MMMTKFEAARTWCPFSRAIVRGMGEYARVGNRELGKDHDFPVPCNCISEKCAAWRYETEESYRARQKEIGREDIHPVGHCGLAGKP